MAQPPRTPPPTHKPNPLHGTAPTPHKEPHKEPHEAAPTVVPGIPPAPNMVDEQESTPLTDATKAEMEAGREALETVQDRARVEHEMGQKLIQRHTGAHVTPKE
jgi:hypothetical protein